MTDTKELALQTKVRLNEKEEALETEARLKEKKMKSKETDDKQERNKDEPMVVSFGAPTYKEAHPNRMVRKTAVDNNIPWESDDVSLGHFPFTVVS